MIWAVSGSNSNWHSLARLPHPANVEITDKNETLHIFLSLSAQLFRFCSVEFSDPICACIRLLQFRVRFGLLASTAEINIVHKIGYPY
jgi:hypothetical protein